MTAFAWTAALFPDLAVRFRHPGRGLTRPPPRSRMLNTGYNVQMSEPPMTTSSVHPYVPNTAPAARAAMLAATGAGSVEDFYADVPDTLRLHRPLDLPPALVAEQDLVRHVNGLLDRNRPLAPGRCFLGAGTYHHHVPAVVDEVMDAASS